MLFRFPGSEREGSGLPEVTGVGRRVQMWLWLLSPHTVSNLGFAGYAASLHLDPTPGFLLLSSPSPARAPHRDGEPQNCLLGAPSSQPVCLQAGAVAAGARAGSLLKSEERRWGGRC